MSKIYGCLLLLVIVGCGKKEYKDKIYVKPEIVREAPSDFLSPEESLEKFYLPEGYKIELVASEPMVNEPVAIAWDGNGKMYVAQMDTYMQNVDAIGEDEPISQIKLLVDLDGDGKMDKSTVFIDSLLLPRMILPLDDRLIVNETYSYDLWSYRDTDNDGVADEKIRVYENPKRRGGNLEHQQSGLVWNLDNWVYTTYNPLRFRFNKDGVQVDSLVGGSSGQWGLTQDDLGNMYYSSAGSEIAAYNFQIPPIYGDLNPEGQISEGFMEPWPVVGTPDVQGGAELRLKPDGTLNKFTGVAGQEIFRGDKLPPSTYGDLFIPEPVGRLVRRAKVKNENGKKVLYNAYDEAEFLASTDLNFRPVQAQTGPDGSLYIVDMYRGIIQEGNWTREGSHLRPVILRKGLDKNIGRGRIYRIVHEDIKPAGKPNLLDKSAAELVDYLGHPNGWYRNTAQKLIIIKGDMGVVPKLKEIALDNESFWTNNFGDQDYALQRVHALWTLEGLGVVDRNLVLEKFNDEDYRVRIAAVRLSEEFLKKDDQGILKALAPLQNDEDINVVNQLALSLRYSKSAEAEELSSSIGKQYEDNEMVTASIGLGIKAKDSDFLKFKERIANSSRIHKITALAGYDIYRQTCVTCHGPDLKGVPNGENSLIAPPLIGSPRVTGDKDVLVSILLNGLTGPIEGKEYGIMLPMGSNDDEWIGQVATYIRAMNSASMVRGKEVGEIRAKNSDRKNYWTLKELLN
ncbi:Cytochrome c, mono-and diheme variants [Arenibacter palladensis]|uniref:Cytochrome c, mono-and diheme variants n=1 Tax=Arenibacter palladensis TaxID=237373 RepID=A0A1M4UDW7_9FLAO|nr:c-type cytochrome [Arenibacter palladensis]SHE54828.1 Cytochrome c, mono-and diheme variants [Arenibacter palladensis]